MIKTDSLIESSRSAGKRPEVKTLNKLAKSSTTSGQLGLNNWDSIVTTELSGKFLTVQKLSWAYKFFQMLQTATMSSHELRRPL